MFFLAPGNVVWEDGSSASRALLGISTRLDGHGEETTTEGEDTSNGGNRGHLDRHQVAEQSTSESMETGVGQSQELGQDGGLGTATGRGRVQEGGDGESPVSDEEERGGGGVRTDKCVSGEESRGDGAGREEEGGDGSMSDDSEEADRREDSVRNTRSTYMEEGGSGDERTHTLHWRCGQPHPKAKTLLLRLATEVDVKEKGAAKKSTYYKKYGKPQTWKDAERKGAWQEGGYGGRSYNNRTWREDEEEESPKEDLR